MRPQMNLSPLAFEILKFLCNNNNTTNYETISKDTLNIDSEEAFEQAVAELVGEGLVETRDTGELNPDETNDAYNRYAAGENTSKGHPTRLIAARIKGDQGNICGEMDYYIGAQEDTDV